MTFSQDQINELKKIAPFISEADEGGYTYILIDKLRLPGNCIPIELRALLCPAVLEGYNSRLYLSEKPTGCPLSLNWNGNRRVLNQTWFAFSWQTPSDLRLSEMLLIHINALRK
jgi:hypothetical protein